MISWKHLRFIDQEWIEGVQIEVKAQPPSGQDTAEWNAKGTIPLGQVIVVKRVMLRIFLECLDKRFSWKIWR